jgi:hypothetical protein
MIGLRRRRNDYSTQDSFDLVDTWSGFPTSYPLRRRTPTKLRYVIKQPIKMSILCL